MGLEYLIFLVIGAMFAVYFVASVLVMMFSKKK
jgi:hypothetical protein